MNNFIVADVGPNGLACVFEDDGETGYFYLYDKNGRGILDDLHIYTRAENIDITENEVAVLWSADGSKCGVLIRNGMRGILDIRRNRKIAVKFESPDSPPITDPEWLNSFRSLPGK